MADGMQHFLKSRMLNLQGKRITRASKEQNTETVNFFLFSAYVSSDC